MNIDNLTYGELKQIAAMFAGAQSPAPSTPHASIPVVVCTDKRAVVFGYCADVAARPINLTDARMCLYWAANIGGVFGLAEVGPNKDCKISAVSPAVSLEGVTAIFSVNPVAEKAWSAAKVQGR